jgi:hypothetical protein
LKGTTLLLVILLILAGVFLAIRFGTGRRGGDVPLFEDFSPEQAARFKVDTQDTGAVLRKTEDIWFVTSEDSLPAESGVVENLLDNIAGFSRKDMISSNPDKYGLYQVDSSGVWVTLSDTRGDTLVRFVAGKPGPDFQSTYIRDVASGDVILAPGYLRSMFDRGKRSWQDRTVFAFEPDDLVEIDIRRPTEAFSLRKRPGAEWFVSSPESAAGDQNRANRLVRTLAYLKCDDFAGRVPVPSSGLADPDSSVAFKTAGGIREELLFGTHREDGRVHVKRAGSDIVYLLATYKTDALLPGLSEMRVVVDESAEGE